MTNEGSAISENAPVSAATEAEPAPGKRIPVKGKPIRLRWLQQLIWSALAANIGALIISGLYYLITQVNWHVAAFTLAVSWAHIRWHFGGWHILYLKPAWDGLFHYQGWIGDRHDVRALYETVLATLFVRSLLAKWQGAEAKKAGWFRLLTAPLVLIVVALPLLAAGIFVINHGGPWLWDHALGHRRIGNPVHLPRSLSWLATYLMQWGKLEVVLVGVLAGLVVHRVYEPVGRTVQGFFVDRQVDKARDAVKATGKAAAGDKHRPRWPLPPVIRERYAWIMDNDLAVDDRTFSLKVAAWTVSFVLFALLAMGAVARYWFGHGH